MKNILEAPFIIETIRTTANMYALGWDERNSGNISLLLDETEVREYLDITNVLRVLPIGFSAGSLFSIPAVLFGIKRSRKGGDGRSFRNFNIFDMKSGL